MYNLVFFHKECQKLNSDDLYGAHRTSSAAAELVKKCDELGHYFGTTENNGRMTENQALNFGSNFLFGIFTVNMGLILLCGSKTVITALLLHPRKLTD